MLITPHFYSLSVKTSNLVKANHLQNFQVSGKGIRLSELPKNGSRCENVILLHLNLKMLNDEMVKPYIYRNMFNKMQIYFEQITMKNGLEALKP